MSRLAVVVICVLLAFTCVEALSTQSRLRSKVPTNEVATEEEIEQAHEMEFVDEASFLEAEETAEKHHKKHKKHHNKEYYEHYEATKGYYFEKIHPDGWKDPNAKIPANMTIPDLRLNKPIIYERPLPKHHPDRDLPIIGSLPKNTTLKKIPVTKNLYGGMVEWKRGITKFGCPCKHRSKKKYRYDAEYKPRKHKGKKRHCRCHKKHRKPKLPPVLPEYYPKKKKHTNLKKFKKFCKKKHIRKHKVAPEYYPKRKHHKKKLSLKKQIKNCLKKFKPKKISPEYYPSKKLNRKQKHAEWLREQGINPATPNAKPSQPAA